jgi:hypothetical protein
MFLKYEQYSSAHKLYEEIKTDLMNPTLMLQRFLVQEIHYPIITVTFI